MELILLLDVVHNCVSSSHFPSLPQFAALVTERFLKLTCWDCSSFFLLLLNLAVILPNRYEPYSSSGSSDSDIIVQFSMSFEVWERLNY